MPQKLKQSMIHLMNQGFAKDKIIVHMAILLLLEDLNLKRIHFKENDETAFSYKRPI